MEICKQLNIWLCGGIQNQSVMGVRVGVATFFEALWALEWAWQVMGVRVGVAKFLFGSIDRY